VKRFTFSLQSVQDHRAAKREAAEAELAQIAAAASNAANALEQAAQARDDAGQEFLELMGSGAAEGHQVALMASHISLLIQREAESRRDLSLLEQAREKKRDAVVTANRDEKAISNLKERHLSRHRALAGQLEQAALDEMAGLRFSRR